MFLYNQLYNSVYVTCTHNEDHVTFVGMTAEIVCDITEIGNVAGVASVIVYLFCEKSRADTEGIYLSCGIDISKNNLIRKRKCFCKIIFERCRSGIGVWLENCSYFFIW